MLNVALNGGENTNRYSRIDELRLAILRDRIKERPKKVGIRVGKKRNGVTKGEKTTQGSNSVAICNLAIHE